MSDIGTAQINPEQVDSAVGQVAPVTDPPSAEVDNEAEFLTQLTAAIESGDIDLDVGNMGQGTDEPTPDPATQEPPTDTPTFDPANEPPGTGVADSTVADTPGTGSPGVDDGGGSPPSATPIVDDQQQQQQTQQVPQTVDLNAVMEGALGHRPSEQEASQLLRLYQDVMSLSPEQAQQLQQVVYGGGIQQQPQQVQQPIPQPQPQPMQPQPGQQEYPYTQPPPQTYPPQQQFTGQQPFPDMVDPDVARAIAPLADQYTQMQQQVNAMREETQRIAYQNQVVEQQRSQTAIEGARQAWREHMSNDVQLTPEEYIILDQEVARSGEFQHYYQMHNGDAAAAVNAIYNNHFWNNPQLRDRTIQQQVQQNRAEQAVAAQRQSKSTALSGGAGMVPKQDPPQVGMEGMVADIEAWMSQQS